VVISAIIGVLAAFFQITGVIVATPVFLWVLLGIAVVYLGILVVSAALACRCEVGLCVCMALNTLLVGILGTVLFAVILLGVGIIATSVVNAILLGVLLFFASLVLTGSVCLVRSLFGCGAYSD
jgi:hypothetical protein